MVDMTDTLDIYGHQEMCVALDISRQRADQLRGLAPNHTADPNFPKPVTIKATGRDRLACGPIWDGPTVRAYAERTGRTKPWPPKARQS